MPIVSVTRLHLRTRWLLPLFLVHTFRSSRQARRAEGLITGWLGNDPDWGFWTSTVWTTAEAMLAYRNSSAHLTAMPKLLRWCDEGSFVHWAQEDARVPDAATAYERLSRDGRASKVDAPSARHQAGITVGDRLPKPGRPFTRV